MSAFVSTSGDATDFGSDGSDGGGGGGGGGDLAAAVAVAVAASSSPPPSYRIDDDDDDDDDGGDATVTSRGSSTRGGGQAGAGRGKKGNGSGGSVVLALSAKTTKIMSAYQEYLTEIGKGFPVQPPAAGGGEDDGGDEEALRRGGGAGSRGADDGPSSSPPPPSPLLPPSPPPQIKPGDPDLARGWSYSDDGLGHRHAGGGGAIRIDRTAAAGSPHRARGGYYVPDPDDEDDFLLVRGHSRYGRSWLRNKRVRRGACTLVALLAMIGAGIAAANGKKDGRLHELEGEMENAASEGEEGGGGRTEEGGGGGVGVGGAPGVGAAAAGGGAADLPGPRPARFGRSAGWRGRTYAEALAFCGSRPGGLHTVCPYDALCPNGPGTEPAGGYAVGGDTDDGDGADADGDGVADYSRWMPTLDGPNSWVQVSRHNPCVKYFDVHGTQPEWGMIALNGMDAETEEVACCGTENTGMPDMADFNALVQIDYATMMVEAAVELFLPRLFDASTGWEGKSYDAARTFCGTIVPGYALCPYEAVCPLGEDTEPLFSHLEEASVWVPVVDPDLPRQYAQVSSTEPCFKYTELSSQEAPTWPEGDTGLVACCATSGFDRSELEDGVAAAAAAPDGDDGGPPAPDADAEPGADATEIYLAAATTFLPMWYDRESGWAGTTHAEAEKFCSDSAPDRELCPYFAICPLASGSQPLGGYREGPSGGSSWVPFSESPDAWVQTSSDPEFGGPCVPNEWLELGGGEHDEDKTRHVACCAVIGPTAIAEGGGAAESVIDSTGSLFTIEKYQPIWRDRTHGWNGQTYEEATEFCESIDHYMLCPYALICPSGPGHLPFSGLNDDVDMKWVPILDDTNDWVNLSVQDGLQDMCLPWSLTPGGEFGSTGQDNEELTRNIVCCVIQGIVGTSPEGESATLPTDVTTAEVEAALDTGNETTDAQMNQTYQTVSETYLPDSTGTLFTIEKYQPIWRDRTDGWNGQTYEEATEFCESIDHYMLCPYALICPSGPGHLPFSGLNDDVNMKWVPILDDMNDWVNLSVQDGLQDMCLPWSLTPGGEFGSTGQDNEELTRNIVCCMIQESAAMPTDVTTAEVEAALDTGNETTDAQMSQILPFVYETYHPTWFDRSKGWHGQTSAEAFRFCSDFSNRVPCPYEALCPMGVETEPLGGYKDEGGETWAPIGDAPNSWVLLSRPNSCVQYSHLHDDPPSWGETGEGNEEITRHLACCFSLPSSASVSATGAPITASPSETPTATPVSASPSETPTATPVSASPSETPTATPVSASPSETPTATPTASPSATPTTSPSSPPSIPPLTEQEQAAKDFYEADWYGRGDGYQGTTYVDSLNFCHQIPGKKLCPLLAYCPSGPTNDLDGKPLYLQLPAFEGEQWAPIETTNNDNDSYILIGTISDNPTSTCHTYKHFNNGELPQWGIDGSQPEIKEHILCCKDPTYVSSDVAPVMDSTLVATDSTVVDSSSVASDSNTQPEWLSLDDGWFGGSYTDAEAFCHSEGRQLCPHEVYCPLGPGQPVSSGHTTDMSAEGIQWAPYFYEGASNLWVMVGQKDENSGTTCYSHEELEGTSPEWGSTSDMPEIKKYIMCCVVDG